MNPKVGLVHLVADLLTVTLTPHLSLSKFEWRSDLAHERVFVAVLFANAGQFEGGAAAVGFPWGRRWRCSLPLTVTVLLR